MAHTFGNQASTVGTTNPLTLAFSCTPGSTVLFVGIGYLSTASRTGTPTYNGISMTQVDTDRHAPAEVSAQAFYLKNPPSGAAYSISVPNSGGVSTRIFASTFKAQAGYSSELDAAIGRSGVTTSMSTSLVVSFAGDAVVDVLAHAGAATCQANNKTLIYWVDQGAWNLASQYTITGSGTTVFTYWNTTSDDYAHIVAAFKEVANPTSITPSNATHSHSAGNPLVNSGEIKDIAISDALHGHTAESITITQVSGPAPTRGHIIRRRHKRYQYPDIQEAIGKQEQEELEERAAQVALEELEQERANRVQTRIEKQRLAIEDIKQRAAELRATRELLVRQREILSDLVELQEAQALQEEDDLEALLMLI